MDNDMIPLDAPLKSINCDVCGKKNITEEICPRCKNDLTILWNIVRCSKHLSSLARQALVKMDTGAALDYASRSWGLKRNELAARCAFLSSCVSGDFRSATTWFRRCKEISL
ncbi:MAG: hypothetical protein JW915_15040 [Chitinispirillaceae bacterium]|nr:hypothetical protein [Chitinispirillaceae bacterium]